MSNKNINKMDPAITNTLINSAAGFAQSAINTKINKRNIKYVKQNNEDNYQKSLQLMQKQNQYYRENLDYSNQLEHANLEYAYKQNLDQWNRENAYNTPLHQKELLAQAGYNPLASDFSASAVSSPQQATPTATGFSPSANFSGTAPQSQVSIAFSELIPNFLQLKQAMQDNKLRDLKIEEQKLANGILQDKLLTSNIDTSNYKEWKSLSMDEKRKQIAILQEKYNEVFNNNTIFTPLRERYQTLQNEMLDSEMQFSKWSENYRKRIYLNNLDVSNYNSQIARQNGEIDKSTFDMRKELAYNTIFDQLNYIQPYETWLSQFNLENKDYLNSITEVRKSALNSLKNGDIMGSLAHFAELWVINSLIESSPSIGNFIKNGKDLLSGAGKAPKFFKPKK